MSQRSIPEFYSSDEWIQLRAKVVALNKGICAYCGTSGAQADHVRPRSKGGADDLSNLVCCCARCNKLAGGRCFTSFYTKRSWIKQQIHIEHAGRDPKQCTWDQDGTRCTSRKVQSFAFCAVHLGMVRHIYHIAPKPDSKRKRRRKKKL